MGTRVFRRSPRVPAPAIPSGELHLEPPPEVPRVLPTSMLLRLLPLVMVLGSVGFVAVMGIDQPTSWLFGGMFALSTLGMVLGGATRGGGQRRAEADEDRKDYLRIVASVAEPPSPLQNRRSASGSAGTASGDGGVGAPCTTPANSHR